MKTVPIHTVASNREKAILLDVRTPGEFQKCHIPGARLEPIHKFDPKTLRLDPAQPCYIICRSGTRAVMADKLLRSSGISHAEVMEGGMIEWEKAGLPVERTEKTGLPLDRQLQTFVGSMLITFTVLGFVFANPLFFYLCGFIGAGLLMAGLTGFCPLAILISRMPWNNRPVSSCSTGCCGN